MSLIEVAIFILLIGIISVPLAYRLRLPREIFLVIGSAIISLVPGIPSFEVDPNIVFNLFLPPVLFQAANLTSWHDFKYNIRPISLLAVGLVIVTIVTVAIVAKFFLPGFTWMEGFLLGAIVSPTDATAATSIVKKWNVPRRFIAVIEGESLINDAFALTSYRFALGAIILGSFSLPHALMRFVIITLGGMVTGFIIGFVSVMLLKRIKDAQAETTFTFIVAFTSYLIAEHFGFSGVISTVTTGIYFGIKFPEFAPSQTRLNAKASWRTMIFIINGFIFTLLGLQLPLVLKGLGDYSFSYLLLYGALISFIVILVRLFWVFPAAYFPRLLSPTIARRDPLPSWEFLFLLGWTGMRGIITLAAVLAIPLHLPSGVAFPHRELLIFITYCVIIATLILPAFTLPFLIRYLHVTSSQNKLKEEALARIQTLEGVLERLKNLAVKEQIPDQVYKNFVKNIKHKRNIMRTQLDDTHYSMLTEEFIALQRLTLAALESQRTTLIKLRKSGQIHDEVFHLLMEELDLEELRARSLRF